MDLSLELAFRERVMSRLDELVNERGYLTRQQLESLDVDGEPFRLVDTSRGIRNPRELAATISVISDPLGPYADRELDGALFRYSYQKNSEEGDNKKLRRALDLQLPIVLLLKQPRGEFVPIYPVLVVADNRASREFTFALDSIVRDLASSPSILERRYVERIVRQRLHQAEFRGRVLRAYETQCAVCNLRLGRLLEASHITPDSDLEGAPVVTNGLSLCKIHHAAYDANLLGVSADYRVGINRELLAAVDGPMLLHGLQEMNGRVLTVPALRADRPDRERLAARWEAFRLSA